MFDFSILISILFTICVFYFTLYITLKKEIGDLTSSSDKSSENYLKINNRKNKLKILNIITIILIISITILYIFPIIVTKFKELNLINSSLRIFSDIGDFLIKLVPFKKGVFSNFNFTFSYITETILSIIVIIIFLFVNYVENRTKYVSLFLLISIYTFIWVNYFVSLFLSQCIIKSFILISIIFNLFVYIVTPSTIALICILIKETKN